MENVTIIKSVEEAKKMIGKEFLDSFYEFLDDAPNGKSMEFARKYGFVLTDDGIANHSKNTLKNLLWFQGHVFSGRWYQDWVKLGYAKEVLWKLRGEGFLSEEYYTSSRARMLGHTSFYYISQKIAKDIYKASK